MTYILKPYDNSLREILDNGVRKKNRTGVETLSIFGMQTRYRIDEHIPVLTGRKVWPKAIIAELLWFLSGSTNNRDLQALDSNIWTAWVDPAFESKHGYCPGSLGPIYGFQLRHFGGEYSNGSKECPKYGHGGFNQIEYMVNELKTNPDSRRNLFSLWNPNSLDKQKLPCCHVMFQVSVDERGLSGMLTQRSADTFIGVPANILFYSSLLYMLAQQTGYKPYELIHSLGDAHIYVPHIEAAEEYLSREKPDSPTLKLNKADSIYSYQPSDFVIEDYKPLGKITVPVMV